MKKSLICILGLAVAAMAGLAHAQPVDVPPAPMVSAVAAGGHDLQSKAVEKECSMQVRAKFTCTHASDGSISLQAVVGDSPENKAFFNATPSGSISMGVVNPAAAEQFKPGAEYYVDFTPVNSAGDAPATS